jgi:tetratricopeptide (TPR) repeat protein
MSPIISIIAAGLTALFLTIPLWNRNVFHTANIDAMIQEGRQGLAAVTNAMNRGDFNGARDSAQAIIERMRSDSTTLFVPDIRQWDAVIDLFKKNKDDFHTTQLVPRLSQETVDTIKQTEKGSLLSPRLKQQVVNALNDIKNDLGFYINNAGDIHLDKDAKLRSRLDDLFSKGVFIRGEGKHKLKSSLTVGEMRQVRRFHLLIIEKLIYPQFIEKDMKRNLDWASEFSVQTAMYFIGWTYQIQFQTEEAIQAFDSLVALYPNTIHAEAVFLQIGQMLCGEGRTQLAANNRDGGYSDLHEAIDYLERIEKNRDIARDFPKYKLTELHPGKYVNLDEASRAKRKAKSKSRVYSLSVEKEELAGKANEAGGTTLEDAVKQIGQCYTLLGQTDSARMQYALLLDFFPESDNLDDAQKLIADSYVKDADMLQGSADSSSQDNKRRAVQKLEKAIKEYQKFINVYPQSDSISSVYICMGDVYLKMGRPGDAQKSFSAALNLAKETESKAKVQLQIGNYYRNREKYSDAAKAYNIILTNYSSTEAAPNALYLLGECYAKMGDSANAIKSYKTIVEEYKYAKEFFTGSAQKVAQWNLDQKNFKDALTYYRMAYNQDPGGPLALTLLNKVGEVWIEMARTQKADEQNQTYKEAIKQFDKVIQISKESNSGLEEANKAAFQLTQCYKAIGNEDAARNASKQITNNPALVIEAIKIIGVDVTNPREELNYWDSRFKEAVENEERASILMERASLFMNKQEIKDYDSALAIYQQVLTFTKDDVRKLNAEIGVARIYTLKKQYDLAIASYARLLENKRLDPLVRQGLQIQLYDALFKAKDYPKALDGFDQFAAQYPEHERTPYAIYQIGAIYAEQKDYAKALEKMQLVVDKYKKSDMYTKAVLGVGEQTINSGKAQEGIAYLEKFLKSRPVDSIDVAANMYMKIGDAYNTVLNNKEKAMQAFETIIKKFPNEGVLFSYGAYQLGMVHKGEGRDKEALDALGKVRKEDASIYRAAQAEMGKIIAKTNPEAAIENYWRIVKESTTPEDSALAMMGIGDVYRTTQKWDKAAEIFKKIHDFYHGKDTTLMAGSLVNLIDALVNARRFDEAIKAAEVMQKDFPDNAYAINTVYFEARSWFEKKNYEMARKKFLEIINLNRSPQLTEVAYFQKSDCYFFMKSYKAAIAEYGAYLKAYPQGKFAASAQYMQGHCYWNSNDFQSASEKFGLVVSKYSDFPDICSARNYYAFALNRIGKWQEARKYFNQVAKSSSCSKDALKFAKDELEKIATEH